MQAWVAFIVTALALAAILALFLPRRQLLLLGIAAVAGIVAPVLFDWRASEGVVQVIYLISALCVVSAILSYLWPWKAWQWGLMPGRCDLARSGALLDSCIEQPRADPVHFPVLFRPAYGNPADCRR